MSVILNKHTPVIRDTDPKCPNKRWQSSLAPWIMTGALFVPPVSAATGELILKDFSDVSYFTLNGDAETVKTPEGVKLRLTAAKRLQGGSVFGTDKASTAQFSTYFKFQVTEPGGVLSGGDGFVFVVQPVSSNVKSAGGGIGYAGIAKSIGVEFDTWNNHKETDTRNDKNDNHIGININGEFNGPTVAVSPPFENGEIWHAWVDYDGKQLEVRTNTTGKRPSKALLTRKLDISKIIGGVPEAFIGFTSATGGAYANHDILSFAYRDSFAPVGAEHVDVWMADSKRDKGAEPNKVSRRFWLSPDIWIRNQKDGVSKYQNVEFGQDNYIYVRARNRGTAIANNTTIEVYRSIPSMGNRWPKSWQFVGKTQIDTLEPNATEEVAIRWDKKDIPKPGHYCFYVRVLNDDDPMKFHEKGDSLRNMRKNNNIVSRNFNVVDLSKNVTDEFEVTVHNPKKTDATIDIVFEEEDKFLDNEGSGVTVDLGELYPSWQAAGGKGVNIKPAGGTKVKLLGTPAKVTDIPMKPAESQKIKMKVAAFKPMPGEGTSREYQFSTQEFVNGKLAGGVDYAIATRAQDTDTDGDGLKDVIDEDDDNDCRPDTWEIAAGLNPLDASDATVASTVPFETILASARKTVDFETMLSPTPGIEITQQFANTHGMAFSSSKTKVTLIKVGEKPTGFVSVYDAKGIKTRRENKLNRPAPDANIGQFLVMAKHTKGADLSITYLQPVAQASGEVLDVDGKEILSIIARDVEGKEVSTQQIDKRSPNSGDGRATRWSFDLKMPVIKTVEIIQRGKGLGVSFDNFSASPLCGAKNLPFVKSEDFKARYGKKTTSESTKSPTSGVAACLTSSTKEETIRFVPSPDIGPTGVSTAGPNCFKMTPIPCPPGEEAGGSDLKTKTVPRISTAPAKDKPSQRYINNGDGTVADNKTGLVWLQNANCIGSQYPSFEKDCCSPGEGRMTWQDAQVFVDELNAGKFPKCNANHSDWRVPTVHELQSIVDYGFYNPAVSNGAGTGQWRENKVFSNVKSDNYWTATPDASAIGFAWRVRFDRGLLFSESKTSPFYVWPVREGAK
ncbi:MAG: hypothetical protein DRR19_08240 [Candidatus Parabeggiatoa sp. nov. 1]|nr:MAG: hypothetical protein DRR19_08240 [Gammaproteobacteria bacterium]